MDDERLTLTIPTELEHTDAFIVWSVGAGAILVFWSLAQRDVPLALLLPAAVITAVWMLTSRSATDVRGIGIVAVFARNKLGERDVHEWFLAFLHYVKLVHVPVWRAYAINRSQSFLRLVRAGRSRVGQLGVWARLRYVSAMLRAKRRA